MSVFSQVMMKKRSAEANYINLLAIGDVSINNGVVSNFSPDRYMRYDNFDTTTKDFCFKFKFNATSVPNEFNCLMGVKSGGVLMVGISRQGKMSMYLSTNESSFNICALTSDNYITLNIDQYCKFSRINGSQYKLELSDDDITYRTECVVDSTADIKNGTAINICFGEGHSMNFWHFRGSIDIGSSNVILNGTKYNYQFALPLTKVGSPTITDGVVSGFSSSNYIANNKSFNITSNFEINLNLKTWSGTGSSQYIMGLIGNVSWSLYFGGSGTGIGSSYGGSYYWNQLASGMTIGIPTNINIKGDGTDITVTISQEGYSKTSTKTIAELGFNGNYTLYFGRGASTSLPFTSGEIDFGNSYEVRSGTKYDYVIA